MSKPVIVFVPGAWHSPDVFDKVIADLSTKDMTSRKIHLPSVGGSPPVSSIDPDAEAIRSAVLIELQNGRNVTVVCHSYGGLATSQGLKGLDKPQSAGGGQVSAIVYIAAYMVPEGLSLGAASAAHSDGSGLTLASLPDGNLFFRDGSNPAEVFYNDLSPDEAKYWVNRLKPHSGNTFGVPQGYAAWKDIPSWYLVATQDKAVPPALQRTFVKEAQEYLDGVFGPGAGVHRLKSTEMDASHSPFLSRPQDTADFIEKAALSHTR